MYIIEDLNKLSASFLAWVSMVSKARTDFQTSITIKIYIFKVRFYFGCIASFVATYGRELFTYIAYILYPIHYLFASSNSRFSHHIIFYIVYSMVYNMVWEINYVV